MNVSEQVYKIIDASQKDVNLKNGLIFNHHEIIKRINKYSNNQYMERNDDAIFWNLATPRIPHFSKNIDLDTKDLQPYGIGEVNFFQTWILKMKFYRWCQENKLALTLNDLSEGLSTYGSMVWKRKKEGRKVSYDECDLANLYFDPTAKTIRETDVVEMHCLSESELRDKDNVWDNVQKVIDTQRKRKRKEKEMVKYDVWELWGEVLEKDKPVFKHVIGYGKGEEAITLYEENLERKDSPYHDFHIHRYMGRWLRVGVFERLFKLQERMNTLVNQNAQTTEIASLLLLRSADAELRGNVMTQAETGMIINSTDLQQIVLQNPGLANFVQEIQLIERQADKLCLTPEVVTGDALPSGTPFRSIATLSNAAKSAFQFIRQSIGETLGYLLIEEVFPGVVKEWNKGEIFELPVDEKDIEIYDKTLAEIMKIKAIKESMLNGVYPNESQLAVIPGMIEQQIETIGRRVEIPENYFDFKFGIRTNITGESVDKAQQNDAMFNAITLGLQNPAVMNIPLFKQYLENNNISWWKLTPDQMQQLQQGQGPQVQGQPIGGKKDELMNMVNS